MDAHQQLIEIEAIKDPTLRAAAKAALIESVKVRLTEIGILWNPKVVKAAKANNLSDLRGASHDPVTAVVAYRALAGQRTTDARTGLRGGDGLPAWCRRHADTTG